MNSIWVDADACPVVIKEMLYRAARRTSVQVTFVANQYLQIPPSPNMKFIQVERGFDVADNEIVGLVSTDDLVITSDIPLAADIIAKGGQALSPRGEKFSPDTIAAQLTMRDLMDTLRGSGIETGGPPAMTQRDRNAFAGHLDRWLVRFGV